MDYKVRFANPQKQYENHRDEFIKAFDDTLSRGAIVNKEELWKFEEDFAKFVGVKHSIGVNSGTSALDVALQAAGIGRNDEVITVGHTFIASISSVYMAGAVPVLVDVGKDFNMDTSLLEKAITQKTKAIMPVHLNGRMCDMQTIEGFAKKKELLIIEDAAQSLGATIQMADGTVKSAGSFGTAGCFSLYWAKALGGFGGSGMITTDSDDIAEKARLMRYNGENREDRHFYYHGHNFMMDNIHAALLQVKFSYFPEWLARRIEIAELYRKGLEGTSQVQTPHFSDERFSDIYTNYVIRAERRDELAEYLKEQSVETMVSWKEPMYKEPVFQQGEAPRLVAARGDAEALPETEKNCAEVLSLPMFPELTNEEVAYVIDRTRKFYE
jgi:dTDP-4-amino-4,6-dideoxygalactose transaminase